jgi:hypothetical protein
MKAGDKPTSFQVNLINTLGNSNLDTNANLNSGIAVSAGNDIREIPTNREKYHLVATTITNDLMIK